MAKAFDTWTVLPHDPIEKLAPNVWRVEGRLGKSIRRVMTVARRADGTVIVHNAIALGEDEMREIEALGAVGTMVVPNAYHRQDARIFKQRYPSVRVLCPRAATAKVAQVVAPDGSLADDGKDADVQLTHLEGTREAEGVMQVRSPDGTTLVFNDVICNLPKTGFPMGYLMGPTGRPSTPRVIRWMVVKDRRALADHFERLAAIPDLRRVIVSHGNVIETQPAETLRAVATELRG